jgi:hypothetical protein
LGGGFALIFKRNNELLKVLVRSFFDFVGIGGFILKLKAFKKFNYLGVPQGSGLPFQSFLW